ncbi:hypothetical protein [Lagierella massiliensis]|uniref:hypothetical protein n=1 Tax=Lagierella massiliensis TaxID=1689303 RepID=UPI0006D7B3AA|nr:hypothetical protein [Lagierella massiliensis]
MKKIFLIIFFAAIITSCKGKENLTELAEIKVNLSENPKLESLINDINKHEHHSAIIFNRDKFLLVYNNPNSKVKDYKLNFNEGELYIDLENEAAKYEPLHFYELSSNSSMEEYIKKHDLPTKIHVLKNGKEIEVVYFENVEIK